LDHFAVKSKIIDWILQLFRNENEKNTRFFAFSPKASKSRFEQAGLLTYPLCHPFPSG